MPEANWKEIPQLTDYEIVLRNYSLFSTYNFISSVISLDMVPHFCTDVSDWVLSEKQLCHFNGGSESEVSCTLQSSQVTGIVL